LDLNHILYFYNIEKTQLEITPQRSVITIVDGIVSGQSEGPLTPIDKAIGIIIGGFNPAIVDALMAEIIGYNISRIPTVYNALYNVKSLISLNRNEEVFVKWVENEKIEEMPLSEVKSFDFIPPKFWQRAMSRKF